MQVFVDFVRRSFVALPDQTSSFYKFEQGPFLFQTKVILCAASFSAMEN